jgi:AcrR family transcriptional regulator
MPRAKLRTDLLRQRVLEVAVDTLMEDGVAGFTTRNIAESAGTSPAAIYELFEDKAGLIREIFFDGFRQLATLLNETEETNDPIADLAAIFFTLRSFVTGRPVLADVMFSRPFAAFNPGPDELAAGTATRECIVGRVGRCVAAGLLEGNENDISHVILALAQGLALQETGGWLGTNEASIDRRWHLAFDMLITQSSRTPT